MPLHLGAGGDHHDLDAALAPPRAGSRLGGADRVAVVGQHDDLLRAGGLDRRRGSGRCWAAAPGRPRGPRRPASREQVDQTRAGRDGHQLAAAALAALLAGSGDLLGEVGDLDPARATGLDAGLDRGADVVDVDVDVPEALAADHDQRVAERRQRLAQRRDRVVVGVEQVHHLVRRPALGEVTGRELATGIAGLPTCGAGRSSGACR